MTLPIGVVKSICSEIETKPDPRPLQALERVEGDPQVAGEAVELVDDDDVEQPASASARSCWKAGRLARSSVARALALVAVDPRTSQPCASQ
jgi:hypothetical protein